MAQQVEGGGALKMRRGPFFFFICLKFTFQNLWNLFWVFQHGNFLLGKSISAWEKIRKITLPLWKIFSIHSWYQVWYLLLKNLDTTTPGCINLKSSSLVVCTVFLLYWGVCILHLVALICSVIILSCHWHLGSLQTLSYHTLYRGSIDYPFLNDCGIKKGANWYS